MIIVPNTTLPGSTLLPSRQDLNSAQSLRPTFTGWGPRI
jgi:hypothetical protein